MPLRSNCRQVIVITLLLLTTVLSSVANAEFYPSIPRNMVNFESYYEISNLADAAQQMRQDAARLGLNINAHPEADKSRLPFAELHLPVTKISPDISDRPYVTVLKGESRSPGNKENCVAILAVYRELSIDEVAKIFESGIQILQNLFAGPGQPVFGGFLVNGRAADLLELQKRDYFAWLGEYSADLKIQPDLGASSINQYSITLYKRRFEDSYFSDLESHQVVVLNKSEQFRRIGVECDWETAKKLCELDWVQSLYPVEYPEPN